MKNRGKENIAKIHRNEFFVAESRMETSMDSVLMLDSVLPVVKIGEREETGNEFGIEGTISMFGEE